MYISTGQRITEMKLSVLVMTSLLVVCLGCKRTTSIEMAKQQEEVELSEEAKKEIEEIVRKAVREELASHGYTGGPTVSDALQDVKAKNELAQIEDKKKNADELVMGSLRIASDAQAWLRKPPQFGGAPLVDGARAVNFEGMSLSLDQLGYPIEEDGAHTTLHGVFTIEIEEGSKDLTIYGRSDLHKNMVIVKVAGPLAKDISTEIKNMQ